MTRMLSELLGAREPDFRLGLRRLEQASGQPNADIRLSTEILQRTQAKICELGLDPNDTTGEELYHALLERLKRDDAAVCQALGLDGEANGATVLSAVEKTLRSFKMPRSCFALKHSVAKRLLKKAAPKQAMAALGYRSLDSFLKHESVALIYAAAWGSESSSWQKAFIEQYQNVRPSDFEQRAVDIVVSKAQRWSKLADKLTATNHQNSFCFNELGAIVLLPMANRKPGLALVSLLFALQELNEIRAASTFLKLQQVKSNFGDVVVQVASGKLSGATQLAGQVVPWQIVQHYYGSVAPASRAAVFEPHVQAEDLAWQQAEAVLAQSIPALQFWSDSAALGLLDHAQPVSLNLFDMALNYCNQLPFSRRVVQFLQRNLWHELMLRYLHQDQLEQSLLGQLQSELVGEPALELE